MNLSDLLKLFDTRRIPKAVGYAIPPLFLKSMGAAQRSPDAILVYPGTDYQGDIVHPDKGDWSLFEKNPAVNYEHGAYVGRGVIEMKSIPVLDDKGRPVGDERVNVPVGRTEFFTKAADLNGLTLKEFDAHGNATGRLYGKDYCLKLADQVARMVEDGAADGVSIEFRPKGVEGVAFKSLGRSPVLNRNAYEFLEWEGLTYAHCSVPVNPSSRLVLSDDDVRTKVEKCIRWAERPGLLPPVVASLDRIIKSFPKPTAKVIPVTDPKARRRKAVGEIPPNTDDMAGEQDDNYTFADDPDQAADLVNDGSDPVPVGVQAGMTFAQGVVDICKMLDQMAMKSDNPKLRKYFSKVCERATMLAKEVAGKVDDLGNQLKGGDDLLDGLEEEDAVGEGLEDGADNVDASESDESDNPSELMGDESDGDADESKEDGEKPFPPKKKKAKDADMESDEDDDSPIKKGKVVSKSYPGAEVIRKGHGYIVRRVKQSDLGPPVPKLEPAGKKLVAGDELTADDAAAIAAMQSKLEAMLAR